MNKLDYFSRLSISIFNENYVTMMHHINFVPGNKFYGIEMID